ncbi:hypothetical protein K439DRAFT_1610381 [Ramaria rubella]|nr:hypothetical protein K439DRAFT_1610381 [Ramaria rubella]
MAPNADPATLVRPNAVADAIVTIQRKRFAAHIIGTLTNQSVVDILVESQWASGYVNSPEVASIIAFPAEYRRYSSTSSRHQLMMDLTTAQCQRKAIGLADAILYGATVDQGQFCIYVSWWKTTTGGTLTLKDPIDLLRCFFFLRRLRHRCVGDMTREFANHDPSYAAHSLATFKWRMKDRPQTPFNWGRTGSEREAHEAGGSVQDEIEDFRRFHAVGVGCMVRSQRLL